jgi:hypothetical protein
MIRVKNMAEFENLTTVYNRVSQRDQGFDLDAVKASESEMGDAQHAIEDLAGGDRNSTPEILRQIAARTGDRGQLTKDDFEGISYDGDIIGGGTVD